MHWLLAGKHPFREHGEDIELFKANLKTISEVNEDKSYFSDLASSLF